MSHPQQRQHLSPSDWDQWARSPVTEAFVRTMQESIEDAKNRWAAGHFLVETDPADTQARNVLAVGQCRVLRDLIEQIEEMKLQEVQHA